MFNQYLFILFIAVLGFLFLLNFKDCFHLWFLYTLSLPIGLVLWSILVLFLVIIRVPHNSIVVLCLAFVFTLLLVRKHIRDRKFSRNDLFHFLQFFGGVSLLTWFFLILKISILSNDSWRFFIGGFYIGMSQSLPPSLVMRNGLVSNIINAGRVYFNFEYGYVLYPMITLSFLLFFIFALTLPTNKHKIRRDSLLYSSCVVFFLFSSYFIVFNAFYIHSNLFFGLYSFLAMYGVWRRLRDDRWEWLVLSCLSLLWVCFLRLEGPIFMLIILVILVSYRDIRFKEKLIYSGVICSFVLTRHLILFFSLDQFSYKYFARNELLFIVIAYAAFLGYVFVSQWDFIRRFQPYLRIAMLYFLAGSWTLMLYTSGLRSKPVPHFLREYGVLLSNILKDGNWGILLIILFFLFVAALILKSFPYESVFLVYIFSFGFLFNTVNLIRGGWREGWGDSGNRMLLHVLFIVAFYVFYKFRDFFEPEKNLNKNES